jgi:hypothetical protein
VLVVEVLLVVLVVLGGAEDEDVVDVVVVVELVVLGGELEVLEVEVVEGGADDEDDELPPLQGCVDSKSVATYKSRVELPPQVSVESPVQGILQELLLNSEVPLPRTTPQ